jgi:UDP-N-acetylmuramoyl-L-alanyl-D-glutamate--2,6-diaminopimelate ligase
VDDVLDGPAAAAAASLLRPAHVAAVSLTSLRDVIAGSTVPRRQDVAVTGASASSDQVRPGDLFAALPGQHAHGARFAAAAHAAGAVAVLTDAAGVAAVPADLPLMLVDDVRAALGPVAARIYPHPGIRVLGVTGTSGKTTTTFFLHAALEAAGHRAALLGTVGTFVGTEVVHTGFTTPEAPQVHAMLMAMAERGVTDVAMEVSSHALELGRVGGVEFAVAGFTNLSQDHLDFHPDMEAYFAAKARLFTGLPAAQDSVIVVDDAWGQRLATMLPGCTRVSTREDGTAPWRAEAVRDRADGSTTFDARFGDRTVAAATAIPGRFNVANALLALAMCDRIGVPVDVAAAAIATATVPGRMERVDAGQPFLAVVDYSHKPAAVAFALAALRPRTTGRLIIVLGCGGDRDRAKRGLMGETAARDADLLIVTDDNPRSEDPALIRAAVFDGAQRVPAAERAELFEIGDRRDAIRAAVGVAEPGDTVIVAGKGHETGQEIGGTVYPFDDRAVLRAELAELAERRR